MKHRITYLVHNPDHFSPEQLSVKDDSLALSKVDAAKEHRITFGLSELPRELRKAFEQWHELHIRWATESPYTAISPFTSRVSPGLHAFFTPHKDQSAGPLCDLLREAFGHGLGCEGPEETFIKLPILSGRFSMSSSSQYYAHVPSLPNLVIYIQQKVCPASSTSCQKGASSLLSASYLDIDYDTISHALILNAYWAREPTSGTWTETISPRGKEETIEIGVLNNEKNPDPEDVAFSGFLTVLGQDTSPKPTRFQTPTRHYPLPSTELTYKTSFSHPTGLHPTLLISLPRANLEPPNPTCKLHAHLTLPRTLFIDKYQFNDELFLASKNLVSLRSLHGATDLEAPDWVVPQWGSAALFELAVPSDQQKENQDEWQVSIPMHLRYLPPSETGHREVPVPWPVVFWACRSEEGAKMAVNPFDRLHLGYEGLFGSKTRFMHVPPSGNASRLFEEISVPVLNLERAGPVEWGTVGVVVAAFLWLCWGLFRGAGGNDGKEVEKGKKKQ
ncbi:PIG-X-domain-containing protein [Zopfia rhizophila CBS 207.26]|uniref:Protein PBN1 n=1 Tax=Zopfia rhizophila CBS 207.26 TaxID=1314779 RepID=A0A6A6DQ20_9PEZI|nr:PIG-X-domain-containing protein [Zopfia rhizophila CBS 207.26]